MTTTRQPVLTRLAGAVLPRATDAHTAVRSGLPAREPGGSFCNQQLHHPMMRAMLGNCNNNNIVKIADSQ
jgi:hypothetical protein